MKDKYRVRIYAQKKRYKRLDVLLFFFYIFFFNFILKNKNFEAKPSDYEYVKLLEIRRIEEENAKQLETENLTNPNGLSEVERFADEESDREKEVGGVRSPAASTDGSTISIDLSTYKSNKEKSEEEPEFGENQPVPIIIGKYNLIYILFSVEFVVLLVFILFHAAVFLLSQWNLNAYLLVAFKNVDSKDKRTYLYNIRNKCTHVYIKPLEGRVILEDSNSNNNNNNTCKGTKGGIYNSKERYNTDSSFYVPKAELVELIKENHDIYFFFKQKKYLFNYKTLQFDSLTHFDNFPISFYVKWKGLIETNTEEIFKEKEANEFCDEIRKEVKQGKMKNVLKKMSLLYSDRWGQMSKNRKKGTALEKTSKTGKEKYHQRNEKVDVRNGEVLKEPTKMNELNNLSCMNLFYNKRNYFELPYDVYVDRNLNKYGQNVYNIPAPCFKTLLYEALLSPFFIFQFFSIILWMLDSYWHFGVFSIFILIVLEAQLISKRIRDFNLINDMKVPAHNVYVYRNLKWEIMLSSSLLPGDIYILETSMSGGADICTCETLLIDGICITDESILTGESVPLIKAAIDKEESETNDADDEEENCDGKASTSASSKLHEIENTDHEDVFISKKSASVVSKEKLDMKNKHKKHIVYAGTKLLLTKNENAEFDNKKLPISGCVGIVLKNGFSTYQGKLVRTIINSSEKVNSSSFDSIVFLFILLFFAICSSAYVIHQVVYSHHERNLYKVLLSVSHVITSVIPPEFPITLSLAVTISVVYLYSLKIYCTEPFRLPFSGKAHICAFDKTGTLTENDMIVLGLFGLDENATEITEIKEPVVNKQKIPFLAVAVIASCHSLCLVEGNLLGDPLEKNSFLKLNCSMNSLDHTSVNTFITNRDRSNEKGSTNKGKDIKKEDTTVREKTAKTMVQDRFHIYKRFFFTSELQRMTCVVFHEGFGGDWYGEKYVYNEKKNKNSGNKDGEKVNNNNMENEMSRGGEGRVFRRQYLVVSKGSPEMMKNFLRHVPKDYDEILKKLTIKGYRVLCLAANVLNEKYVSKNIKRELIEKDLLFCGFLTFICPIKNATLSYIDDIRGAGLKNIMITGDNALTACQVAQDVNLIPLVEKKNILIVKIVDDASCITSEEDRKKDIQQLDAVVQRSPELGLYKERLVEILERENTNVRNTPLFFFSREGNKIIPFIEDEEYLELCSNLFTLCITGDIIEYFIQRGIENEETSSVFDELIKRGSVFCRVSPKNKEIIIKTLNKIGNVTVMCGDGTNDMAALKAAHVGVSLLSLKMCAKGSDESSAINRQVRRDRQNFNGRNENPFFTKMKHFVKPKNKVSENVGELEELKKIVENREMLRLNENGKKMLRQRLQHMVLYKEEKEQFEKLLQSADDSMPLVKLGEASIASPFTYKGSDIKCVKEIISCGRCALSKVIMMYKLMIINSLITAFSVSILTLDGVKIGDVQTTAISLVYTALVVLMSKATPLETMSNYCPPNSLFNPSVILSLIVQVVVHFTVLIYGWKLAASFRSDDYVPDLKGEFSPNLVNTCIYYLIYIINLSIFSCNYEGLPFMIPLHKHKEIMFIFTFSFILLFVQIMEIFPFLNNFFSLVSFPSGKMKLLFLALSIIDIALPYLISVLIRRTRLYVFNTLGVYI